MSATQENASPYPWWHGAAIYQIYPRSFLDTNGDGVGDLPGIAERMDYIASLGVDAIWISPFFTSPMHDFGYDVADFCDVDPVFGTLADFDRVVEAAHARGVRVLIDQVYAHTSDEHPWFVESRAGRNGPKADWYVWADAKPEGSPPSNWQSVFGGPAWTWDARRRQYYLHTFLREQPQLNVHKREVQDALLAVARFWLERGVDGFRLDALNHSMHDLQLRDNPPAPDDGRALNRPYDFQRKLYSQSHPDVVKFIERIRGLCDEYGATFTLAEVGGRYSEPEMKAYTAGNRRLNSAYGFNFLYAKELTPKLVAQVMAQWDGEPDQQGRSQGWPSWAFENHDAPRAVSRWCAAEDMERFARMKLALLASLRGNIILYQGEELGLEQDEIPFELLQDPEAIDNWPLTLSRDGARTPMPWSDAPQGGFTTGSPWLPMSAANIARAVESQQDAAGSLLALTRRLLSLREATAALRHGDFVNCFAEGELLSFERVADGQRVRCIFNFGSQPASAAGLDRSGDVLLEVNADGGQTGGGALPGYYAAWIAV